MPLLGVSSWEEEDVQMSQWQTWIEPDTVSAHKEARTDDVTKTTNEERSRRNTGGPKVPTVGLEYIRYIHRGLLLEKYVTTESLRVL